MSQPANAKTASAQPASAKPDSAKPVSAQQHAATPKASQTKGKNGKPHNHHDPAWSQLTSDMGRWCREQSFALIVTGIFIVVNICWWLWYAVQHKTLPYNELSTDLGNFDLARLIPSLFLTRGVFQLIVEALLMLLVLCLAEPILGGVKTLLICIGSAVGGTVVGLLLCLVVSSLFRTSDAIYHIHFTLSPVVLVIGALMAASCFSRPLWRRRVRLIGYTAILVVLLYGGNPGDYCVLMTALLGQLIGRLEAGKPRGGNEWQWEFSSSYEVRRLFGAIGVVLALGPIVATTSRSHAGPLTSMAILMSPESVNSGKLAACMHGTMVEGCFRQYELARASMPGDMVRSVLPLVVMLLLAWGVYLGRRTAAIASVVLYGLSAVITVCFYLFTPFASFSSHALAICVINTIIPLLYAIGMLLELNHFPIRTSSKNIRGGVIALVCLFLVCSAAYLIYVGVSPRSFSPAPSFGAALADLPGRFMPIGFLTNTRIAFMPVTAGAKLIYQGVGMLFWIGMIVVAVAWLCASSPAQTESAKSLANKLVEDGGESMTFMTTWDGNDYWISSTGRSAVAYRVLDGIALTTTGPFGDPDEWMDDLDEFSRFASDHSWSPVFYAVHQKAMDYLLDRGWHYIMVGEEMVIDPQQWKTTGKKWQDVRTAVNKAKKLGIHDEYTIYDDAPESVQRQIQEISDQWSSGKSLPPMGFTLGGVKELKDPRVKILYAIDDQGVVQGCTSWLPTWRDGRVIGYTLDFMRYREGSYNGIMEFLIASMAQRMHDQGVADPDQKIEFVSLSGSPMSGLNSEDATMSDDDSNITGTIMLEHAMGVVANMLEPAYGFRSLYNFKKKFQPAETPMYIAYRDPALLANMGIAILRAYLPTLTIKQALGMLSSFSSSSKPEDPNKDSKS